MKQRIKTWLIHQIGRKRTVDGERKTYQTAWREPA